jgi:hypothetical protein
MKLQETFWTVLTAAAFAGALGAGAPARAEDPPAAAPAGSCVRGRDLMTAEERNAHRAKMQAATPEEQAKLRAEMHAEMVKRAAAKKLPLCAKGPGAGMGAGAGRGPGGPPATP